MKEHPDSGNFFEVSRPFSGQEHLEAFFKQYPDTDLSTVIVLPQVAELIGGAKSRYFNSTDPIEGKGTTDTCLDVDPLNHAEYTADARYPYALLETQELINEIEQRGGTIEYLVIPDVVRTTAAEYLRRLTRLAQNTSKLITIRLQEVEGEFIIYDGFAEIAPPAAQNVNDYWESRQVPLPPRSRETVTPPLHNTDTALNTIIHEHYFEQHVAALEIIASSETFALQELLPDASQRKEEVITKLLAISLADDTPEKQRNHAQIVLAKLGNETNLIHILTNLNKYQQHPSTIFQKQGIDALSIYLKNDPALLGDISVTVEQAARGVIQLEYDMFSLMGALYSSRDVGQVGTMTLRLFEHFNTAPVTAATGEALSAMLPWLPEYVQYLHESPNNPALLMNMKDEFVTLLDSALCDRTHALQKEAIAVDLGASLARILYSYHDPHLKGLLSAHIMDYFEKNGSIITSGAFERQYLRFRAVYGDIAEISQHITIRP